MKGFAVALGILGVLTLVMGILTATDAIPLISDALTWTFWLIVSAILFLSTIAVAAVFPKEPE